MNQQEFEATMKVLKATARQAKDPVQARKMLISAGILTPKGKLSKPYR